MEPDQLLRPVECRFLLAAGRKVLRSRECRKAWSLWREHMRRRKFIKLIGGAAVAWPLAARALQAGKVAHVGALVAESAPHPFPDAFRAGLQSLGYSEGHNIEIEWRYADGLYSRAVERG